MSATADRLAAGEFQPLRVLDLDLAEALPELPAPSATTPHSRIAALVRLHGIPLGMVSCPIPFSGLTNDALAALIDAELHAEIAAHLARDGLHGLQSANVSPAPCERDRLAFLEDAPEITVLIPSRERPDRLRRCVQSIMDSEYPKAKITVIVVDNAPETDRNRLLVEELNHLDSAVRVVYAREDAPGSASARNRGLELVQTEVVAMTDDDVVVDRRWLTEVARTFAEHPAAGAVSGLLWPAELETRAQLLFEQYGGFSRGFELRVFDLEANRPADEPLYPWNAGLFGTGNNFSFRTDVLREIGAFDPALGNGTPALGGVDSEVLLRTVLCGHQIVYQPRAIAYHAHRADYEGLQRQIYAYGAGLVAYYLKTILADRRFALDFLRKLPAGLRWMLSSDSHINKYKLEDYPAELTWLERRGMLYGPLAYARSRRRYGPHRPYRHETGPPSTSR